MVRISRRHLLGGAAAFGFAGSAVAQTKPIRILVGFAAGGGNDVIARLVAQKMSEGAAGQVLVDNKTGASGLIAADILAKAPPDGTTLMVATQTTYAVAPQLYKSVAFDAPRDVAGVCLLGASPLVLVVNPSFAAKSVGELIERAKAKPGAINYGSGGVGTSVHIVSEYLAAQAGISLVHVPYKQMGELNSDFMSGRIQLVLGPIVFHLPHIRAGRHVPLAVTSTERVPLLPDVPTVAEAGVPGFEYGTWYGLIAPAHTPKAVLDVAAREVLQANDQPDVRERMASQGLVPKRMVLADFDAFVRAEIEKLGRIVKASGAKAN